MTCCNGHRKTSATNSGGAIPGRARSNDLAGRSTALAQAMAQAMAQALAPLCLALRIALLW